MISYSLLASERAIQLDTALKVLETLERPGVGPRLNAQDPEDPWQLPPRGLLLPSARVGPVAVGSVSLGLLFPLVNGEGPGTSSS